MPNCYKLPEDELVGVMTDTSNPTGSGDFQFDTSCPAWVKAGMANPNQSFTSLLGYEADRIFNISNYLDRTWHKISDSLFVGGGQTPSHAVYYRMTSSGARVFGAGTVQWAWGLDPWVPNGYYGPVHPVLYNSDAEVVTRNILACLRDGGTACGEN